MQSYPLKWRGPLPDPSGEDVSGVPTAQAFVSRSIRQLGRVPRVENIIKRSDLTERLHWKFDPFAKAVAEDEYQRVSYGGQTVEGIDPYFSPLSYYVDPQLDIRLLDILRHAKSTAVFGDHGSGKTTLRLALESMLRALPDRTLVVTYKPATVHEVEIGDHEVSLDSHRREIVRELIVDLFIQVVEQLSIAQRPDARQNDHLCSLIRLDSSGRLVSVIERIKNEPKPGSPWGYADYWPDLGRNPVRSIYRSEELLAWLEKLIPAQREPAKSLEDLSVDDLWCSALQTVQLWGFRQIFILVDNVDDARIEPAAMLPLVRSLLAGVTRLEQDDVYLKCFLPSSLRSALHKSGLELESLFKVIPLNWDDRRLRAMLRARFRAAGSYRYDFADLAEESFGDAIDDDLIRESKGSPRRLLNLVDELLRVYLSRLNRDSLDLQQPITRKDFLAAKQKVCADALR